MRRTIMRYANLSLVMIFTMICPAAKKRFPTLDHLQEAGFLLPNEKKIFIEYALAYKWSGNITPINIYYGQISTILLWLLSLPSENVYPLKWTLSYRLDELNPYNLISFGHSSLSGWNLVRNILNIGSLWPGRQLSSMKLAETISSKTILAWKLWSTRSSNFGVVAAAFWISIGLAFLWFTLKYLPPYNAQWINELFGNIKCYIHWWLRS